MADTPDQPNTPPDKNVSNPSPSPQLPPQPPPPPRMQPHIQFQPGGWPQIPPQLVAAVLAQQMAGQPQQLMLPFPGIIQQAQHWQGPYPPPEAVERYERVLPGTFHRFITMAEELQAAQISQSEQALDAQNAEVRRGHWLGFATTAFAMMCSLICAAIHQPWVAGLFLSVPVMAVGRALIETSKAPSAKDLIPAVPAQPNPTNESQGATNPNPSQPRV